MELIRVVIGMVMTFIQLCVYHCVIYLQQHYIICVMGLTYFKVLLSISNSLRD